MTQTLQSVRAARTAALLAGLCAGAALLAGCASQPESSAYVAAGDARQRQAAENTQAGNAGADTQATYLRLVEEMQKSDLWFASLAHIDALEQRWGASPVSHRLRADALRHAGQAKDSEAFYKRLMGTPLEADALRGMGLLAGGRADYAEAARLLELARRQRPADSQLLCDLGYALMRSGKLADARLPLMKAFQLRPDSPQAQVNLAVYFEASRETAQATALMEGHNMPQATRAAIRRSARQLDASLPPVETIAVTSPSDTALMPEAGWPLALKASQWAGMAGMASLPSHTATEGTP
jgi:Flp pilus assembly protein TadD